jgi:hypothetical protein
LPQLLGDEAENTFKRMMYNRLAVVVVVLALFSACKKEDKRPVGILSEPKMVHALIEMYLAEEKVETLGISYDSIPKLFPKFEERVFTKLNIPDSVFKKSLEYYRNDPKKLEVIYTAVVDSLSLKAQALSVIPKSNAVPD